MIFLKKNCIELLLMLLIEIQLLYITFKVFTDPEKNLLTYLIFVPILVTFLVFTIFYRNNQVKKLEEKLNEYNSRV